jgi:DNA polymerase
MGIQVWRLRRHLPGEALGGAGREDDSRASCGVPEIAPGVGVRRQLDDPAATGHGGGRVETMDWEALRRAVAGCRACGLCDGRTQTVFGVGNEDADLLVVGEAPGVDEDRQGEPFVGRAGQLLNRMLAAIGLQRGDVYIANILKCRPPGNRDPRPDETAACRGFLMRQIDLIRPSLILSVGRISAQNLLGTDEPVGRLRGRWFEFGPQSLPLTVTYHPSYLLRSPEQKAKAWKDLLGVARRLRRTASRDPSR